MSIRQVCVLLKYTRIAIPSIECHSNRNSCDVLNFRGKYDEKLHILTLFAYISRIIYNLNWKKLQKCIDTVRKTHKNDYRDFSNRDDPLTAHLCGNLGVWFMFFFFSLVELSNPLKIQFKYINIFIHYAYISLYNGQNNNKKFWLLHSWKIHLNYRGLVLLFIYTVHTNSSQSTASK